MPEYKKISLNAEGCIHYISLRDIIYVKANRAYCTIFYLNSKMEVKAYSYSVPLKTFISNISDPRIIRIHNSWAVNRQFIKKLLIAGHQWFVELEHISQAVPVSRSYRKAVRNIHDHF